jgi:hypothetical protein
LVEDARRAGLKVQPYLDVKDVLANRARFWAGYAERLSALKRSATQRLGELTLSRAHQTLLVEAIEAYCRTAMADHRPFEASSATASDEAVVDFYMRYYAQPIRLFLMHP